MPFCDGRVQFVLAGEIDRRYAAMITTASRTVRQLYYSDAEYHVYGHNMHLVARGDLLLGGAQ